MGNKLTVRPTVRVLLIDDCERVLLFRGCDPAATGPSFWFPPGGGIEDGETPSEAARREVWEETGLVDVELGPHMWNRRHVFWFDGRHLDLREVWFMARTADFGIDTAGFTPGERLTIREHRWWTQHGLATTTDLLTPRGLAGLLADLRQNGPPSRPMTVEV